MGRFALNDDDDQEFFDNDLDMSENEHPNHLHPSPAVQNGSDNEHHQLPKWMRALTQFVPPNTAFRERSSPSDHDDTIGDSDCHNEQNFNHSDVRMDPDDDDDDDDDLSEGEIREWPDFVRCDNNSRHSSHNDDYSFASSQQHTNQSLTTTTHQRYPLHQRLNQSTSISPYSTGVGGDAAPIHYHIYYTPDPSSSQVQSSRFRIFPNGCGWLMISLVAVLAHILYWYGPTAPPIVPQGTPMHHASESSSATVTSFSSASTWNEFWMYQSKTVVSLISSWYSVSSYVMLWCWQGLQADVRYMISSYSPFRTSADPNVTGCRWDQASMRTDVMALPLFGQEMALQRIQDAFMKRQGSHSSMGVTEASAPLVFFASGGSSVGKQTLATLLSHHFLHGCTTDDDSGILTINMDAMHKGALVSLKELSNQMINHAAKHPNGNIIVLSHFPLVFEEYSQADNALHSGFAVMEKIWQLISTNGLVLPESLQGVYPFPTAAVFSNTILLITSSFGSEIINKMIRRYGRQHLPPLEVESFLRYQLENAYGRFVQQQHLMTEMEIMQVEEARTNQPSTLSTSKASIVEDMVILPFLPLGRDAVADMIRYHFNKTSRVRNQKGKIATTQNNKEILENDWSAEISISNDTMDYLLDETTIEWQTWIHKTSQEELITFASKGGKGVLELVDRLQAAAEQKLCHIRILEARMAGDDDRYWLEQNVKIKGNTFAIFQCPTNNKEVPNEAICQSICTFSL